MLKAVIIEGQIFYVYSYKSCESLGVDEFNIIDTY